MKHTGCFWGVFLAFMCCWGVAYGAEAPQQTTEKGLRYTTTWFGNSWAGGPKWVQTSISGMRVLPDGRVLTMSGWDEAHREATIYASEDGDIVAGVTSTIGSAIAGANRYVYVPVWQDVDGKQMSAIARFHIDEFQQKDSHGAQPAYKTTWTKPAPFEGGVGRDRNRVCLVPRVHYEWTGWKRAKEIEENPAAAEKYRRGPQGIKSVVSNGKEVYVCEDATAAIHVLDPDSMAEKRTIKLTWPGAITLDGEGNLWVVLRPEKLAKPVTETAWLEIGQYRIVQLTPKGEPTGREITDCLIPSAIACGGPNGYLYVADSSPQRMQVLVYDVSGGQPRRVATLGEQGGVLAEPDRGKVAPDRFQRFSGVGVDAKGCVYISTNDGGSLIRKFSPDGKILWERYVATFMNGASFDTNYDGTVIYAGRGGVNKFAFDYEKSPGEESTWTAVTADPFTYPHDHRNYTGRVFRMPNGRLYMYSNFENNGTIVLRQEPDSEIFVPSVFLSVRQNSDYPPEHPKGRFMWRDVNGDGQMDGDEYVFAPEEGFGLDSNMLAPDANGDLWLHVPKGGKMGIWKFPLKGFDVHGNPIWDFSLDGATFFESPDMFCQDRGDPGKAGLRLHYEPESDTMYIFGFPPEFDKDGKQKYDACWAAGSMAVRFDNWSSPARSVRSKIQLPYCEPGTRHDVGYICRAVYVAGELIFAARTRASDKGQIWVYNSRNGEFLGVLKPGPLLYGETSLVDIPDGLCAFRRDNGEYIVTCENNWKNLQIMYRIPPQALVPADAKSSHRAVE